VPPDPLDQPLADGLGPDAAEALRAWAGLRASRLNLRRWFPNGRSGALVGVVYEDNKYDGGQQLVLKLDQVDSQRYDGAEYARHRSAVAEAGDFAGHLSELAHDPIAVRGGRAITFQKVVAGSLEDARVLSTLIDAARAPGRDAARALSETCAHVIESVLANWAVRPHFEELSAPAFLAACLADRLKPGKPLYNLVSTTASDQLLPLDREESLLVNPFALLVDGPLTAGLTVQAALTGKAHGDLHSENVLIPVADRQVPGPSFWLIDLARYESLGPLARDPAHLMLYVAARALPDLTANQADVLLKLLLDPGYEAGHLLPGWLVAAVTAMHAAGGPWARGRGLGEEWQRQTRLAIVACALMFTVRKSMTNAEQSWFLRLAAHAATAVADDAAADATVASTGSDLLTRSARPDPRPGLMAAAAGADPDADWVAMLCEHLPTIRRLADKQGLSRQVEELLLAARLDHDASDQFSSLIRKLGGPSVLSRGIPGLGDGQPVPGQVYVCPARCPRTQRRAPGKEEPRCHVNDHPLPLRKW
jgi:hypothetical protein